MKRYAWCAVILLALLVVGGCSSATGGGSDQMSDGEAQTMTASVASAVSAALANCLSGGVSGRDLVTAKGVPASTTVPIDYSGSGYSASGDCVIDNTTGAVSYDITISFSGYTYADVTIPSGSASLSINGGGTSMRGVYFGNFTVVYKGTSHSYNWDLEMTCSGGAYTYVGVFYVDYHAYTYNGSGTV